MAERLRLIDIARVQGGTVSAVNVDNGMGAACFGAMEIRHPESRLLRHLESETELKSAIRVSTGDVAVASIGSAGQSAVVDALWDDAVLTRDCLVVRLRPEEDRVTPEWLYAWTWSHDFRYQMDVVTSAGKAPRLTARALAAFTIPILPRDDQNRIGALATRLDAARKLAAQTASLLDRLQRVEIDLDLYGVLD